MWEWEWGSPSFRSFITRRQRPISKIQCPSPPNPPSRTSSAASSKLPVFGWLLSPPPPSPAANNPRAHILTVYAPRSICGLHLWGAFPFVGEYAGVGGEKEMERVEGRERAGEGGGLQDGIRRGFHWARFGVGLALIYRGISE